MTGIGEPAFPWRGLLVDVCRHWISPAALHRTLDAMALARLNVLHLHLSDDQAHRLESHAWPRLHTVAHDGHVLRHDDVRALLDHAGELGIRVVPELDMPGHTTAWLAAYPHLAAAGTAAPDEARRTLGIAEVAIDPEADATFDFLGALLDEVVALFPDEHLHLGGDEVHAAAWPGRDLATTQAAFTDRVVAMAFDRGRTPVVWDEAWHPALDRRVVLQVWRGHARLRAAAAEGRPVLFSTPYYLDLSFHPIHHAIAPTASAEEWLVARGRLWDDPTFGALAPLARAMEQAADLDAPIASEAAGDAGDANVLGGEACLWTELCDESLLDLRLWPATLAVADALWTGRSAATEAGAEAALTDRLERFVEELRDVGIDLAAQRHGRWLDLAGGDDTLADDLGSLARCCEPVKWYGRHGFRVDTALDAPLDRFVDALPPEASGRADDPDVRSAAERLVVAWRGDADVRRAEVADIAAAVVDGTAPIETFGEVLVVRRHDRLPS